MHTQRLLRSLLKSAGVWSAFFSLCVCVFLATRRSFEPCWGSRLLTPVSLHSLLLTAVLYKSDRGLLSSMCSSSSVQAVSCTGRPPTNRAFRRHDRARMLCVLQPQIAGTLSEIRPLLPRHDQFCSQGRRTFSHLRFHLISRHGPCRSNAKKKRFVRPVLFLNRERFSSHTTPAPCTRRVHNLQRDQVSEGIALFNAGVELVRISQLCSRRRGHG